MAGSINKTILVGNLGKDPEVRSFQNGGKVVNLTVATSDRWKNKEGEYQEKVEWHNVSILNDRLAGVAEKYLRKGSKVYLEGKLQTRKYQDQQSGQDRYITEIVLGPFNSELQLLDPRGEGEEREGAKPSEPAKRNAAAAPSPAASAPAAPAASVRSRRAPVEDEEDTDF